MSSTRLSWNSLLAKLWFSNHSSAKVRQRNHLPRRLRLESLEQRRLLAITVDNPMDELDIDVSPGDYSLREAIRDANPAGDIINFDPTIMNGEIITLLSGPGFRQIAFAKSLTIDASMLPDGITIDAGDGLNHIPNDGDGFRIFDITDPTFGSDPPSVTMIGLTLTGGDVSGHGGAIRSEGSLELQNSGQSP